MGAPGRVELPTNGLGNRCSIHLSYGAVTGGIRSDVSHYLKGTGAKQRRVGIDALLRLGRVPIRMLLF